MKLSRKEKKEIAKENAKMKKEMLKNKKAELKERKSDAKAKLKAKRSFNKKMKKLDKVAKAETKKARKEARKENKELKKVAEKRLKQDAKMLKLKSLEDKLYNQMNGISSKKPKKRLRMYRKREYSHYIFQLLGNYCCACLPLSPLEEDEECNKGKRKVADQELWDRAARSLHGLEEGVYELYSMFSPWFL